MTKDYSRTLISVSAVAGFTSPTGRSHTFDSRADGYARSEASISTLLRPLGGGGLTWCVSLLEGCSVRQDGRSASLTAPNGQAQQHVISSAMLDSNILPKQLGLLEAHGTGTALGDPIEMGAVGTIFCSDDTETSELVVCSIKACSGHAEPGARLSGMISLLLQFRTSTSSRNARLRRINPYVREALRGALNCQLPAQPGSLLANIGGVSSFGYTGTIAHLTTRAATRTASRDNVYSCKRRAFWWYVSQHPGYVSMVDVATFGITWLGVSILRCEGPNSQLLVSLCWNPKGGSVKRRHEQDVPLRLDSVTVITGSGVHTMLSVQSAMLILSLGCYLCSHGRQRATKLVIVTISTTRDSVPEGNGVGPATTASLGPGRCNCGIWGLSRVLRTEVSPFPVHIVGASSMREDNSWVTAQLEQACCASEYFFPRLRPAGLVSGQPFLGGGGSIITGGLGGLGIQAAICLQSSGATRLVLTSRSGVVVREGQGLKEKLYTLLSVATAMACDASDAHELRGLFGSCAGYSPQAVLHACGVPDITKIADAKSSSVFKIFQPKALAAWLLHCLMPLSSGSSCLLFSSISSVMGQVGQAPYASANSYLDALAQLRRTSSQPATSLQLPLVADVGMGAAAFTKSQLAALRVLSISLDCFTRFMGLLSSGIQQNPPWILLLPPTEEVVSSAPTQVWLLSEFPQACDRASRLSSSQAKCVFSMERSDMESIVINTMLNLRTEGDELSLSTPIMEAGFDSLSVAELAVRLSHSVGIEVSSTLAFDHPTPRAIAAYLLEKITPTPFGVDDPNVGHSEPYLRLQVHVHPRGQASRWPGGSLSVSEFWDLLKPSGDAINAIPRRRWVLHDAVDVESCSDEVVSCLAYGGFIRGAQWFDSSRFGIREAEAVAMDPQQRVLLETSYAALHHSWWTSNRVETGAFVGIERPDWSQLPTGPSFGTTRESISVSSGRISYVLNLQGACMSIDSACSSSLAAAHVGVSSGCVRAIVAGVSFKLSPAPTLAAAHAGMLSPRGRCFTFDRKADGYA